MPTNKPESREGSVRTGSRPRKSGSNARRGAAVVAALAGGTLLSSCNVDVKAAIADGTINYLFSVFNPETVAEAILGEGAVEDEFVDDEFDVP